MDQWKLILQALLLTMFLPLLLWTLLFTVFGWKLFLFMAIAVALLLMYGDKLIQLPMFKSLMRMLVPFGTTFSFYKALRARKDVKEKQGSSWQAWWASLREFLSNSSSSQDSDSEDNKPSKRRALPETAETAKEKSSWFGRRSSEPEEKPAPPEPSTKTMARQKASEEEIEQSLAALKAKMARDKGRKPKF